MKNQSLLFAFFFLLFSSFVLPVAALAAPFEQWFTGTSPQGAQVRVWGQGDEYSVRYEAEDGHTVVKDAVTRKYFYARQDSDGAIVSTDIAVGDETDADRVLLATIPLHLIDTSVAAQEDRQQRIDRDESEIDRAVRWTKQKETMRRLREAKETGLLMAPPSRPTLGTVKGLTILIDFPIEGSTKTTWETVHPKVTTSQLGELLNGESCTLYGNASSVHSYYYDVSNGRLDYSMVVIGPIMAPHPRMYYDDETRDNGECARDLIADVFKIIWADANFNTKYLPLLQSLTTQDNVVRSLNIWFAGDSAKEWSYGLWAHKWVVGSTISSRYTFTVNNKTIKFGDYQITPITSTPGIYTFCHENGHMLCDFPDLYNYEKGISGNRGVGYFSLMFGSSDTKNPPYFDAYLRAAAGWVEPQILPSAGGTVTVRNNHTDVWKYENPENPSEYYLIENRQKSGRDASIKGSGILIWRCNERGDNCHPDPTTYLSGFDDGVYRWNYELSLEQADGDYDIERDTNHGDVYDPWYMGNRYSDGVFNDGSIPTAKWADTTDSGLALSDFSENGETMTFTVAKYRTNPINDDFADAIVINSQSGSEIRSSVGATKEDGEPTHIYSSATKSIWWRLEISKRTTVTLSTEGSTFDTCLVVYTGNAVNALTKVAGNDDAKTGVNYSEVSFDAEGGDVYYVAVAGYSGATGDVVFKWTQGLPDLKPAAPSKNYPYPIFVGNATNAPAMTEIAYGDPIYYTYRIINVGTAAISGTEVAMKHCLYDEDGTLVKSAQTTYAKFSKGTTLTWSKSTIFNGLNLHDGKYKIVLTIDSGDAVRETDETNNEAAFEFSIVGGPAPEPEPGVWTTDAERVRLSAAVDGRMICVAKLNATLSHWSELGPILNSEQFLSWAAANGVYLVKWNSTADSSGTSKSAEWFKNLYAQRGAGSMYNWEMCFARPNAPDTFCGYARAYGTYSVGTVKYDATVTGMIAGFASILSANGLTPISQEIAPVVSLFDWEKGTPQYEAAVAKIAAIAAGDNPAVDPQTLRGWIGNWQFVSAVLAASDYVVASAFLNTQWPITEEADVAFVDVEESSTDGFSFRIELKPNADESPEELTLVQDFIASCIQTTGDLGTDFKVIGDPTRVTIDDEGKVTITPDQTKSAEFFKIVIPKDPAAK